MSEHTTAKYDLQSGHDSFDEAQQPERAKLKEVLTGFHDEPDTIALELEPNPDEPLAEDEVLPEVIYPFDAFTVEQQKALKRGEYVELPSMEVDDLDNTSFPEDARASFAVGALGKVSKPKH